MTIRSLVWPDDRVALLAIDASYSTDRVLRIRMGTHTVTLDEVPLAHLFRKVYPLAQQVDDLSSTEWVRVADDGQRIVGIAALGVEVWNRRAVLSHLYVEASARGRGVGRALVDAAITEAHRREARCLWVETQTTNLGAVRFYRRLGFTWCGFDTSLYDPDEIEAGESALFFMRPVS